MDFNEHTPGRVFLGVKYLIALAPAIFGEHAAQITEVLEVLERDGTLENVYRYVETIIIGEPKAEQVLAEQLEEEQVKTAEEAKAELVKADAVLAAAVIEHETIVVEHQIADEERKAPGEIDALKKDFEREQQDLEGKLDGLARNYFEKHPDLSEDARADATKKFESIKEEEMGNLRGQQETRLEELTRARQEHREVLEELEERRKELEGTRADRS